jgi:hypothetical protein
VTMSVACEWLFFRFEEHTLEYITDVSELVAAYLCDALIIMQFFTYHFKAQDLDDHIVPIPVYVIDPKQHDDNVVDDNFVIVRL